MLAKVGFILILGLLISVNKFPFISALTSQGEIITGVLAQLFDPKNYDPNIRPYYGGVNGTSPVEVQVEMYVRELGPFDYTNDEFKTQITFKQRWIDDRLRYSHLVSAKDHPYITPENREVWTPDLYFSNEKSGHIHDLLKPNRILRIFPNGEVTLNIRLSLTLVCSMSMNLRRYPLDEQFCPIRIASYGRTSKDIVLKWKSQEPVQVSSNNLKDFKLRGLETDTCDSKTSTGVYGCLSVQFNVSRNIRRYLMDLYVPSLMFVIISWLTFWLSPTNSHARVTISMLSLISTAYFGRESQAKVPYSTAHDIWNGVSISFTFWALFIYIVANYLERQGPQRNVHDLQMESKGTRSRILSLPQRTVTRLDYFARIVYPILFLLFAIIYAVIYEFC